MTDFNDLRYFVSIRFFNGSKPYYFGTNDDSLKVNDEVIVETIRGIELGVVYSPLQEMNQYSSQMELKPVLRKATADDINRYEENIKDAKLAMKICMEEISNLNLPMNVIDTEYTLDRNKLVFSYLADERVDFRELLHVLASRFRTRIELRQIGPRDRAKNTGGIGICGLKLCCTSFLNEFDGISINRAKNQLLALNIPKLSGHCGKLICCLKFEDDNYTKLKEQFPAIGERIMFNDQQYRISSYNVFTEIIKLENREDVQFLSLEEVRKLMKKGKPRENEKRS